MEQNNFVEKKLLPWEIRGKIFLLRHLPVKDDANKKLYELQKKKVRSVLEDPDSYKEHKILAHCDDILNIDPDAISEQDLSLYDTLLNVDSTVLILPPIEDCKLRIRESIQWVQKRYPWIKLHHIKVGINPRKDWSRTKSISEAWLEIDAVINELGGQFSEWSTYVILGSRSHASSFMLSGWYGQYSSNEVEEKFEKHGYLSWDIGSKNTHSAVVVTPDSLPSLQSFINTQVKDLLDFQNHLNKTLHESPEITREYLLNKSAPASLQRPCFVLCLERGDIDTIGAFVEQQEANSLDGFHVEQLISRYPETHGPLLGYISRLSLDERGVLKSTFDNLRASELYTSLLEKAAVLDDVNGIFRRSLDPDVRKHGRHGAIVRSIVPTKINEYESRKIQLNTIHHADIWKTLSDGKKYNITGIVWTGKTTWIASVVHDLMFQFPEKNIAFFEAKKLNVLENLEDTKKYWNQLTAGKDIICIDGIDEISVSEVRNDFLKTIEQWNQQSNLWLIVTSRPQWIENHNQYRFNEIKPDVLFQERIPNTVERGRLIYKLTDCCGKDFENNPLLLTLIQLLHKETPEQWGKWQILWIKPLEEITNLGELYETITRLILVLQDREKSERRYHGDLARARKELDRDLNELWKFALGIFDWVNSETDTTTLSKLNLLYEDEDLGLQFMHKSFLDFFVAREIAQSDTKVDEFFGIDRFDYRNSKEWARRRVLVEYILWLLPDTKKIELMTETNWLYRAISVSSEEINTWVNMLLLTAKKNIYKITVDDFLNDTEIKAALWEKIGRLVLYRKITTGPTEANFNATYELMTKIISGYLNWDTSLFKIHVLTFHSKWTLLDEETESTDINNLLESFNDAESTTLLRYIKEDQNNKVLSLLTGLALSNSDKARRLFVDEFISLIDTHHRQGVITYFTAFTELFNYKNLIPYYKQIELHLAKIAA